MGVVTVDAWIAQMLPDARPLPKGDAATRAWRTPALFVKAFPAALADRAAVEAEIAGSGLHEAIVPSLLMARAEDGVVLVYPFVSGETLGTPEARQRFYALPEGEKRAAITTLFDACAALGDAGWTLVDLYEGNLIYDYENRLLRVFDWDLCRRGPFTLESDRNYGSSRLMPPEEFVRGSVIDARSNVFTLARIAQLALSEPPTCLVRAVDPDPERRFPTVRALAEAFRTE